MTEIFSNPIINWTWYCKIDQTSSTNCTILLHDRKHNHRDYDHPKTMDGFELKEDKNRIVHSIVIYDHNNRIELTVDNPMFIFDYPTFETVEKE